MIQLPQYIQKDDWIGEILKKNSFNLTMCDEFINNINNNEEAVTSWLREIKSKHVFVFTKIDTTKTEHIEFVEKLGFNLIDTNVTLKKNISFTSFAKLIDCKVLFAESKHKEETVDVAKKNFIYSRFHLDNKISNKISDEIKGKWVGNYFSGKRGDKMIIAKINNKIIGFLQLLKTKNEFIIDLIAIDKNYRNKGIALNMIEFAENYYFEKGYSSVIVGTQISNIPSIKLYQKLGFNIEGAKYVFHYHN